MNKQNSIEYDLDMLAHLTAKLLATPVATITIYESDSTNGGAKQAVAHNVIACDKTWAASHSEIDIDQLGGPRTAVAQHLGLYAAVPMRNGDGSTIGMVACADDAVRDLSDGDLETLKHISALATAAVRL